MTEPVTREGRDFVRLTVRELYLRRGIVLDADEVAGLNERIRAIEDEARKGPPVTQGMRPDGPDDSIDAATDEAEKEWATPLPKDVP